MADSGNESLGDKDVVEAFCTSLICYDDVTIGGRGEVLMALDKCVDELELPQCLTKVTVRIGMERLVGVEHNDDVIVKVVPYLELVTEMPIPICPCIWLGVVLAKEGALLRIGCLGANSGVGTSLTHAVGSAQHYGSGSSSGQGHDCLGH